MEPGGLFVVLFAAIDASLDLVAPLRVDRVAMGVLLRRSALAGEGGCSRTDATLGAARPSAPAAPDGGSADGLAADGQAAAVVKWTLRPRRRGGGRWACGRAGAPLSQATHALIPLHGCTLVDGYQFKRFVPFRVVSFHVVSFRVGIPIVSSF